MRGMAGSLEEPLRRLLRHPRAKEISDSNKFERGLVRSFTLCDLAQHNTQQRSWRIGVQVKTTMMRVGWEWGRWRIPC